RVARRLGLRWTPTATAALLLRLGPHGDRFLPWSSGLNLARLKAAPHGVDLGPLEPGIARRVLHRGKRMQLAAAPIVDGLGGPERVVRASDGAELLLIGRRELRTNNSWMHNVPALVAGRERCVLFVHPADAERARVHDGDSAILESRIHRGSVRVQLSDDMAP